MVADSPTRMGSQLPQSAHDKITRRKPSARTKARRMTAGKLKVAMRNRQVDDDVDGRIEQ